MRILEYIKLTKFEVIAGTAILLVVAVIIAGTRLSRLENARAVSSSDPVHIYLEEDTGLEALSEMFADSNLIDSKSEMVWAGKLLGWRNFRRGHYEIDGRYSYDVLLSRISRGIQDPIELTVVPGSSKSNLVTRIASNFHFDSTAMAEAYSDSALLSSYQIEEKDLLGRLLPDTYLVYWTSTPESVLKRILNEFDNRVREEYEDRIEELGYTLDEIITLASIIEWEAHHDDEKPKISGLYWNRLNRGMRLQADPTVLYAIGERRRVLYEDYKIEHPYNTYIHRGLPPGPITNPDLESIKAALYPQSHDYLYMVANPDGYHVFSETFEQHKEESKKWRKWIRKQYRLKKEREAAAGDVSS